MIYMTYILLGTSIPITFMTLTMILARFFFLGACVQSFVRAWSCVESLGCKTNVQARPFLPFTTGLPPPALIVSVLLPAAPMALIGITFVLLNGASLHAFPADIVKIASANVSDGDMACLDSWLIAIHREPCVCFLSVSQILFI